MINHDKHQQSLVAPHVVSQKKNGKHLIAETPIGGVKIGPHARSHFEDGRRLQLTLWKINGDRWWYIYCIYIDVSIDDHRF